jgi:putative aldouronate transport system permease protein
MKPVAKRNTKNKIHIGSYTFEAALVIFMVLFSVVMVYPLINVIAISLSSSQMISSGKVTWFPREITFMGYEIVFGQSTIWISYLNTIKYAVTYAVVNLFMTSLLAYTLLIPEFALRKPITIYLLITMFFSGGTVPTYLVVRNLGLMNTMWALVLPAAISAYNVFVYRAFYRGLSIEIREAAKIDGAGDISILFRIYMPLSKALYATFGLFAVVGMWNSYFSALLYIKDEAKQPIQNVLRSILFTSGAMGGTFDGVNQLVQSGKLNPKNVQYATIFATVAPVLMIYPFIQKYFVQGVQVGAVKG